MTLSILQKKFLLGLFILFLPFFVFSERKVDTSSQNFSLKLGATRVIYNLTSSGTTVAVFNEQDFPILVQSKVLNEDKISAAPFIVTPPLFRLDAGQQNRVRIVRTGGDFPEDRESMRWLCVTGIPPKMSDDWAKDENGQSLAAKKENITLNIQMIVSNCIKIFIRPATLKNNPLSHAGSLIWTKNEEMLTVKNPSPFYMNLRLVKVGEKEIENIKAIPPFSDMKFPLPKGETGGQVKWQIVSDLGGESRIYQAEIQ